MSRPAAPPPPADGLPPDVAASLRRVADLLEWCARLERVVGPGPDRPSPVPPSPAPPR